MQNIKQDIKYFIIQNKYNIKNAYALSRSFWVGVVTMMMNNLTFFIIWILFMQATGPINGWTSFDVFGMLGVSLICYGFTHAFFYGVAELPQHVLKGSFDNVLLSPTNSFFKIAGSSFSVSAYGDLLQGIFVFVVYGILIHMDLYQWGLYIFATLLGCVTYLCMRFLCSIVSFFIHDSEVISQQLFEIFNRPTLYPGAIFPNKLKIFFMTIIPALLASAVPIDLVKLNSLPIVFFLIFVTIFWILITYVVYKIAIKRYESGNYLR